MAKVLVACASLTKHAETMAEAMLDGVWSVPGTEGVLMGADEAASAHVRDADALIVGSLVRMAGPFWRARTSSRRQGPLRLTDERVRMGGLQRSRTMAASGAAGRAPG